MNVYRVYFEIYDKKMRTDVVANNEEEAMDEVRDKTIFHKVERVKESKVDDKNPFRDSPLGDIFNEFFSGK